MDRRALIINYTEDHKKQLKSVIEIGGCKNIECEYCIFNIRNSVKNKKCSEIGNIKGKRWKEMNAKEFIEKLIIDLDNK
ncbi:hypothetical protein H3N56_02900 [Cetobacterium sp. 2A]|uniref:hypothetical protein n=1 Tax=unclassified Cetobacterium TaxID=2630983 RepID=UPI00163CFE74|nr:hypothetical protein [Cetobacterium sp. 2A]MBC2855442.1 hypothetical protein [Cetobacterium sp. 2A]